MIAYHPQCGHCSTIVDSVKSFAEQVKQKKLEVNVIGVNMSKADREVFDTLKIRSFPTIRLYKKDGSVV